MLLVTGAAGYIGSMLIHEIYPEVQDIRAIDDFSEGHVEQIHDIRVEKMDVSIPDDVERMHRILKLRGLENLPLECTIEDVCRDDLLVELDATAVIARPSGR